MQGDFCIDLYGFIINENEMWLFLKALDCKIIEI
jgi:hypothetical protein